MNRDTQHEGAAGGRDRLQGQVKAVGSEQVRAAVILTWYRCGRDLERLKQELPGLSGAAIGRVIGEYLPIRSQVEDLLTDMTAAHGDLAHQPDRLREWLSTAGLEQSAPGGAS